MNKQTTDTTTNYLLTVNAGSSSIKFVIFSADPITKLYEATVTNIGQSSTRLVTTDSVQSIDAKDHTGAAKQLVRWLATQVPAASIIAVGHRVVHGGPRYYKAQTVTHTLLTDLQEMAAFDPEHLPVELQLIRVFDELLPEAQQVACFDTEFHHDLPAVARQLPIPRKLTIQGIRRYGFHGLSYASILEELRTVEGEVAANGKVIIAHLGSGVSLAALHKGASIDTTMAMTPASGVPMSTRSGDLDPGLALYLANTQGYDIRQFHHMVNFESGLLGMSETTADMEKLLEIESTDERAKEAIAVFCYEVKKSIGSLAAALGGLNTLVFTGGMGENAPKIRAKICEQLDFLGVTLDDARNKANERLISAVGSPAGVHVIHADEARTIARQTIECINNKGNS